MIVHFVNVGRIVHSLAFHFVTCMIFRRSSHIQDLVVISGATNITRAKFKVNSCRF